MITDVTGCRQGRSRVSTGGKWGRDLAEKRSKFQKDNGWIPPNSVDRLSPDPGAYGLLIRLPRRFLGRIGALGQVTVPAGTYLYCGSAYGPGGLPARLRRHLRADKRLHWHVDHLTVVGLVERVFVLPDGRECDLVDCALQLPATHAPVAGFGSSDCRRCTAHLLAIPNNSAALINAYSALI
jgi:Uri superfamily endonuclease